MVAKAAIELDGIYYNFSGNEAEVTYSDREYDSYSYYGSVVIPEFVDYNDKIYRVSSIGDRAFSKCQCLTSVTIPGSVTRIGSNAFSSCYGLTSITIPESVTSISDWAFCDCTSLTSVTIPKSVTDIGEGTFSHCSSLLSVTLPNYLTSIGSQAFLGCYSLTSIIIPNNVIVIGSYAFGGCFCLTSVTIGNCVKNIGERAFSGCGALTSITIPKSVTNIESYAFAACNNLKDIYCYAENVPSTDSEAFSNSPITSAILHVPASSVEAYSTTAPWSNFGNIIALEEMYNVEIDGIYYNLSGNEAEVTRQGINIASYSGVINIPESITFGNNTYNVTRIDSYAFNKCTGLTSVFIPNSVLIIEEYAFSGCTNLSSVDFGNGVVIISEAAFFDCSSLTSITIPNSVTSIGIQAFSGCNLQKVIVPDIAAWCGISFNVNDASGNPLFYSHHLFSDETTEITNLVIPEGVTSIGDCAFVGCTGITDVTIPNSVTNIGNYAFDGCSALKDVYCYAENVPTTSSNAFSNSNISSATLHVPTSSVETYNTTAPWNGFGNIQSLTNTLTYIVDGEVYKTYEVECGATIIPEPAPIKEGYTFSGWNEIPATMPYEDVVVTGMFIVNQYTISFDTDGGSIIESITQDYGSPITTPENPTKEGYTFIGWEPAIPESMPLNGLTVKALWQINSYILLYLVDGEEYKTSTIVYGTEIAPEKEPTKEGYAFSGWSEIPATMPAHDVVVTGTFTINSYALAYVVDDELYKTYDVEYGAAITPEPAPTKEGYTFSGWSEIPTTMPAHDVVVTGTFTINSYTLTYKVDNEVYKTYEVEYGAAITPEPAPTKDGYTFSGWSEIPETMPAHDVTVTGSFMANSYTLTYIVDGQVYKTYTVACGTAITPEEAPTKEGYTFSGWSYIPATMPATDVVVMGSFTINSYTLTYMVDGEQYKSLTVVYGSEITPEAEPTKEGYTFSGWSEIPETMPAGDVVVTGTFTVNSYILTYIVDGDEYKTSSVDYGTALTPEEEPTKEGYTFSGWSEIPETMPAEDVTVTGSFTINQYLLTYIIDGEEYKSYEVDFNTAIIPEPAPVRKGMTFSGWGDVPETMPAYDLTLSGTYSWSKEIVDGVIYQVTDTLSNYASVVGTEDIDGEVTILSDVEIGGDFYTIISIEDNALPKTITINISVGKLLLWLWNNGYEDIRETGTGRSLAAPEISMVAQTASSLTLSYKNDYPEFTETVIVSGSPITKGKNGYEVALKGLEPDYLYEGLASLTLTLDEASYTKSFSFRTEPLTLATQQPKIVSLGNVVVAANSNLDDEEKNVGFEWRRTDWTEDFASNFGTAYLYEGTMEGYIRNLNIDKLWKYRPYYESNAGNRHYGDWVGIDPTNISYFVPTVHTYSMINLIDNLAEIWGYVMRGTDNITSQGFMYWSTGSASSRRNANGIPSDAKTILASGNVMTATLENLDYDTEYCYLAFVTTSEGETFYGEPQTFRTGEGDPDGIKDIDNSPLNIDHSWYDLSGRKIDKPQKGINIIRYSDGTSRKVLVK